MKVYSINYEYNSANSVNFTGYRTMLGKKIDQVLKLDKISADDNRFLVNEIKKLLSKRLEQSKNMGEGTQNRVYKIDDKYVLRIPINKSIMLSNQVVLKHRKFASLKNYYGEALVELGNVQILKNATPGKNSMPAGIPKVLPDNYKKNDLTGYYNNLYLPTFANIPQKSYNALAKDMSILNSIRDVNGVNFSFDYYNPNNVVLSGKTLKMTDDIAPTFIKNSNSASDMFNVFLKQLNDGIPAIPSTKLTPLRQIIARKILKASIVSNLPITSEGCANNVFGYVIKFLCNSKDEPSKVFETVNNIKNSAKSLKQRQIELDKYLDTIF